MKELKAGFARIDITPEIGINLAGYAEERIADGILDPLLASAVAVSDSDTTAVIFSLDLVGIDQISAKEIREAIEKEIGVSGDAVYIACTHTHLGPASARKYADWCENVAGVIYKKLVGLAKMAVDDLKPAQMFVNSAETPTDISFVRRFKMKDGSIKTNPGINNPNIDHPMGEPDRRVALVTFKRENAPEIALINFQVHPDVVWGEKYSADYPHFVRKTYEAAVENSLCMYINGAQGDTNHFNVHAHEGYPERYEMAEHMGRVIAGVAMGIRATAKKIKSFPVCAYNQTITVQYNKANSQEELEEAKRTAEYWTKERIAECGNSGGIVPTATIYAARNKIKLSAFPDDSNLYISGLSIGDFAIIGFPGEPFTEIGRQSKNSSKFEMTFASCCTNGFEGYFPVSSAFDEGGYEAATAIYKKGVAEKLIDTATEILETLYKQANK
ncbi:MAG: neutral/alkaline non-lysosomal ceramidase N-terminal domain-containing protein [Clostridia bacterium]|nr:neutral/alkaline non-lysosomal ceramidase N-terminal domain-containing protein [Clostridia bacterium]